MINTPSSVEAIGHNMFESIARTFPVACASDEFYYFPQVRLPQPQWSAWDCFSSETITEFVRQLSAWEDEFNRLSSHESELDVQIDIILLQKLARTLQEQLSEVRSWESQPTFYLTLACVGLAEAMESEEPAAKHERARNLPAFLDQANRNLSCIPVLFRDIGLKMVVDTRNYLLLLEEALPELRPALAALDRFEDALQNVSIREDFLLPRDLLERIIRFHLHCDMDIQEINHMLDQEIEELQHILEQEAGNIITDKFEMRYSQRLWGEVLKSIPVPDIGKEGLIELHRSEINKLAQHCLEQGLVSPSLVSSCPVRVAPMPPFLSAIRSASSYSIPPRHPPTGGKFYIFTNYATEESQRRYLREYKMTCAHETYPGHHLLDTSRWSLTRPLRRFVEQPIFYEGWACFAEELMSLTRYFSNPGDRLLLSRRRLLHAIRGKVDIGLQTGTMNIPAAFKYLKESGISTERATSLARKYPLNPGYQLCYTLGLRRFLDLYDRYGRDNLPNFAQVVLEQGEIHFMDLEKMLQKCQ